MWKRWTLLWNVVRGDAGQLWRAVRHPEAPGWLRLAVALLALYVVSPIDLVPDFVPFLGAVDDLVLVPLAIRWLVRRLPAGLAAATTRR